MHEDPDVPFLFAEWNWRHESLYSIKKDTIDEYQGSDATPEEKVKQNVNP